MSCFTKISPAFSYCRLIFYLSVTLLSIGSLVAHPMPNTLVLLDLRNDVVYANIHIPLQQLDFALSKNYCSNSVVLVKNDEAFLKDYMYSHLKPTSIQGKPWRVSIAELIVNTTDNPDIGKYDELVVKAILFPYDKSEIHHFIFDYDAIIHQVITHIILVSVRQDWSNGINESGPNQLGSIQVEVQSNKYYPLVINLDQGNQWKAILGMIRMGIKHISHGTDHLLFIITLLLPAMLIPLKNKWGNYIGLKSSAIRLLKIITAFTIGHSLTLALGAMHWFVLETRPIEILIAATILCSAIHAFRPIYSGKEIFIAGGFGLIHGLAFAETLTHLQLNNTQMVFSIFGFNIGIECMQLIIVLLIFPVLILLSKTSHYTLFRKLSAVIVILMALAWMIERIQGQENFITKWIA